MKNQIDRKKFLKDCAVAVGVGLVSTAVAAILINRSLGGGSTLRLLSDAFMCGSAILLGYWCIGWAAKAGMLDWFTYCFSELGKLIASLRKKKDPDRLGNESYGEYSERKEEIRKGKRYTHFLIVGLLFLAAAVVTAVLCVA